MYFGWGKWISGCVMNKLISHKDKKKKFVYDGSHVGDMHGVDERHECDFDDVEDESSVVGLKTTMVDNFLSKRMGRMEYEEK